MQLIVSYIPILNRCYVNANISTTYLSAIIIPKIDSPTHIRTFCSEGYILFRIDIQLLKYV